MDDNQNKKQERAGKETGRFYRIIRDDGKAGSMETREKLRILLVDDEREEREGIEYLIRKYKYPLVVSQAQNGVKALELIEHSPVDILFTDVKMPLMNGLELAKKVNQNWPEIKIIIFSAYGEFSYAKQALEANAVNYLLKPIEVDEFCKVMEDLIQTIQMERSRQEEQRQEKGQNRQNVFYKILTGAPIQQMEREQAGEELFSKHRSCRPVHVEFLENFFERNEELFRNYAAMYFGKETEYMNLYPNEAYLLIRDKNYMESEFLEQQFFKFARDVNMAAQKNSDGIVLIVGKIVDDMAEFEKEIEVIQEIQRECFSYGEVFFWTEKRRRQENYSRDVETVRKQLNHAIELNQTDMIRELTKQLVAAVQENNRISKIYVQNLFYTIIQGIYDRNPNIQREIILNSSDILFYSRNAKEMVALFQKNIEEMLADVSEQPEDESGIIRKVRNIVEKEYMHDLGLNEVAAAVNLAPAYVSYIFKKETGTTLVKYITEVKMEKARALLVEGRLKINQVAEACGYENPSYFNRIFKNYFGVTPKQFREG